LGGKTRDTRCPGKGVQAEQELGKGPEKRKPAAVGTRELCCSLGKKTPGRSRGRRERKS